MRIEMVTVNGGSFYMGGDKNRYEEPVHMVTVSDFYIGRVQVTQVLYQLIMGYNPSPYQGNNLPVEHVNWFDAITFCNTLSHNEGLEQCYLKNGEEIFCEFKNNGYRLPTEAEWEFAARGGRKSKGYEYSGSNNPDEVGWYNNNSGGRIQPVGLKKPNELGIFDMSGNVAEWCWDLYQDYSSQTLVNPTGPNEGQYQILRGGSWDSSDNRLRCAYRSALMPHLGSDSIPGAQRIYGFGQYQSGFGFRLCKSKFGNDNIFKRLFNG